MVRPLQYLVQFQNLQQVLFNLIQIGRMIGIIIALMFGVAIAAFVFSMGSDAEGIASGELQINNTKQMNQLVLYNSVIAYQCTPNKGGYEVRTASWVGNYWSAWSEYRDVSGAGVTEINWGHLEAAGSNLECYGSESKLPGAEGNLVDVYDDSWLNDQGGKYSRKDFRISDSPKDVYLGPCLIYNKGYSGKSGNDPQSVTFLFTGEETNSAITIAAGTLGSFFNNRGPGYNFNGGGTLNSDTYCEKIGVNPPVGNADSAIVSTVTLIGAETSDTAAGYPKTAGDNVGKGHFESSFNTYRYRLCEGTRGYIQTNVGKNTVTTPPDFSTANAPGSPDREVGLDQETNLVHPFIVFTNWEDDCY